MTTPERRFADLMSPLTPSQQRAVAVRGNVLVVAGAGTGKTMTLVERCLAEMFSADGSISLNEILMVTFTEAAAAEMRQRIRTSLEHLAAAQPDNDWLAEQLALLDTARISTLHSFCLGLIREHFYELGLDPQLSVLDEAQARLLAADTLEQVLEGHYAGQTPNAPAVQALILEEGGAWDEPVRRLVLRLHHYAVTRADPQGWFEEQLRAFDQPDLPQWEGWLVEYFRGLCDEWLPVLRTQDNDTLRQCVEVLERSGAAQSRAEVEAALEALTVANTTWAHGTKEKFFKPNKAFFDDVTFLSTLARGAHAADDAARDKAAAALDPIMEDWQWVRGRMRALLELTREFGGQFAAAKREQAALDFHDLEQLALDLLWDRRRHHATPLAEQWRRRFQRVFVDEYQDINEAQDRIIQAVSRADEAGNRFLVGDVKQSIYGFRLANPHIFQSYRQHWSTDESVGTVVYLSDNFRSHEAILNFLNPLFAALMRRELGGVAYDAHEVLQFGDRHGRAAWSVDHDPGPRVELHLRITGRSDHEGGSGEPTPEAGAGLEDLSRAEIEARMVAVRLRELRQKGQPIRDKTSGELRPVEWRDIVILLRSLQNKAEVYAKEFERLGVPLQAPRGGFYEATEVSDLVSLLTLLDNPMQDLPVLAVLRSPIVGLTANELATIRLAQRRGRFWLALQRFHQSGRDGAPNAPAVGSTEAPLATTAWPKVDTFLRCYSRWRRLARLGSLSQCLEAVLAETHYEDWLLAQPRGEQRRANVARLLNLSRQFDQSQRQGLFRFLRFLEAQKEAEIDLEPAPLPTENAVRLMSIHQSKGLEFPVVVVADLGKRFNFQDLRESVIIDERYGLCPEVKPPQSQQRYPSLCHWLAQRRQRGEKLGEELRLLYVAMSRAEQRLLLTGTASRKAVEGWGGAIGAPPTARPLLTARSYLDWLGQALPRVTGTTDWTTSGSGPLIEWQVYADDARLAVPSKIPGDDGIDVRQDAELSVEDLLGLKPRLEWRYPYLAATREPAKTTVTAFRRRVREDSDDEGSLAPFAQEPSRHAVSGAHRVAGGAAAVRRTSTHGELSAADIGTAHHLFQQFVNLARTEGMPDLRAEADRLERAGVLSPAQRQSLDLPALHGCWASEIGRRIRAQAANVHRELPFTARVSLAELAELGLPSPAAELRDEFVIVQGVVDLAVVQTGEIWIVDYKTDHLTPADVQDKLRHYAPQLQLYARALSRIYGRPVTESWLYFLALNQPVRLRSKPD